MVNHPVTVKGAVCRMDGVEVRELAKPDLPCQVKHGALEVTRSYVEQSGDSSNQCRP